MKKILTLTALMLLTVLSCTKTTETDNGIQVKTITLSESNLSMMVGDQAKLTYMIDPLDATDLSVEWVSLDPSIATVDDAGLVTAMASGSVNIMVKSSNGVYATCLVEVAEQTVFNRMVGHWTGYKIEWLDNVTGEILGEDRCREVLWPGQDDEWYESNIEFLRTNYTFDLYRDSSMQIGILCVDLNYRYIPGTMTESEAENTFHGSFEFSGTKYANLTELYELDFKYSEEQDDISVKIHIDGKRYDVIRYYKVTKQQEEIE